MLLIATVLVGPVSIYGGEMLIRTELFSLPPLAMMIVATADNRRVLTAIAGDITVMAPLHIVTHYGNELYDGWRGYRPVNSQGSATSRITSRRRRSAADFPVAAS